jgi:hypothetical protein
MLPPLSRRVMDRRSSDECLLGVNPRQDTYDDPESPFISTFRAKSMSSANGRNQHLKTLCKLLAAVSLLSFGVLLLKPLAYPDIEEAPAYSAAFHSQSYVQGPPTQRFRGHLIHSRYCSRISQQLATDNLRNDTKYITSWISAGWSTSPPTHCHLHY